MFSQFSSSVFATHLICAGTALALARLDRNAPYLWPFRLTARPGFFNMPWLRRVARCPRSAESSVARAPPSKKQAGSGCSARQRPSVLRRPATVINNISKAQCVKPGPHDFHTAMEDWVDVQRQALRERIPGSLARLDAVHRRGLVVTTHYSGTGAAEMAVQRVAPGRVRFHSACDINPICREVLLNHSPECAAEHVMLDICARPPRHVVDELQAALLKCLDKLRARTSTSSRARASSPGQGRAPRTTTARHVGAATVQSIGLEWVEMAMKILEQWTPKREDAMYCARHDRDCPVYPQRSTSTSSGDIPLHLEVAGINCQPWTAAGQRLGWLDDRSIPSLILIRMICMLEPDAVCIECTPGFDFFTLQTLLPKYRGKYAITCPTDFGRPVSRRRMYMWFDLLASVTAVHAEVDNILDVSARSLIIGPGVFLTANSTDIQRFQYNSAMQASRSTNGPPKPVLRRLAGKQPPKCKLNVRDTLPAGTRKRYLQHREQVVKARRTSASFATSCYIVDVHRSPGWGARPQCRHVPTILRSSQLLAMHRCAAADRMLLPSELPAMHGLHLPARVLCALPASAVRSLVGNSMHVAQVGCFVQYALATRSYRVPSSEPDIKTTRIESHDSCPFPRTGARCSCHALATFLRMLWSCMLAAHSSAFRPNVSLALPVVPD